MADLLYHIDEIARRKKTDVVWIAFEYEEPGNWERMPQRLRQHRTEIILWMEQRQIPYEHCFGVFGGALEEPYRGDLCVDLPIDKTNKYFAALEEILEHSDKSPKIDGVQFYLLSLKIARKNKKFYQDIMDDI
jgi:hypothetical protein